VGKPYNIAEELIAGLIIRALPEIAAAEIHTMSLHQTAGRRIWPNRDSHPYVMGSHLANLRDLEGIAHDHRVHPGSLSHECLSDEIRCERWPLRPLTLF
jgi:hypothetical protein